jgi:hypothetical protein
MHVNQSNIFYFIYKTCKRDSTKVSQHDGTGNISFATNAQLWRSRPITCVHCFGLSAQTVFSRLIILIVKNVPKLKCVATLFFQIWLKWLKYTIFSSILSIFHIYSLHIFYVSSASVVQCEKCKCYVFKLFYLSGVPLILYQKQH